MVFYKEEDDRGNKITVYQTMRKKEHGVDQFMIVVVYGANNVIKLDGTMKEVAIRKGENIERVVVGKQRIITLINQYATAFKWKPFGKSNLIGQGVAGCAYFPALSCDGSHLLPDRVAKVMSEFNADEEIKTMELVTKIDPDGKYHWKFIGQCNVPKDLSLDGCNVSSLTSTVTKKMLIFPFGGGEFTRVTTKKVTMSVPIMVAFINVFKALVVFEKHNFVHNDIKAPNILFTGGLRPHPEDPNPKPPQPVVLKLSDFGISFQHNAEWQWEWGETTYQAWPPQTLLLDAIARKYVNDDRTWKFMAINFAKKWCAQFHTFVANFHAEKDIIDVLYEERDYYRRCTPEKQNEFCMLILSKHDVYSAGVVLVRTISNFDSFTKAIPGFIDMYVKFVFNAIQLRVTLRFTPELAHKEFKDLVKHAASIQKSQDVGSFRDLAISKSVLLPTTVDRRQFLNFRKPEISDLSA